MARTGRNDRCPCGSGKKYKHCCSNKETQQSAFKSSDETRDSPHDWMRQTAAVQQDPEWLKIRVTEGKLVTQILEYAIKRYGEAFWREALPAFLCGEKHCDEDFVDAVLETWAAFTWVPGPGAALRSPKGLPAGPLAMEYLERNRSRLSDYEQAFIRAVCEQPFSFFEVTDVAPGKSIGLRDVLVDRRVTVKEAQASRSLKPGDALYARVLSLEGQAIMIGVGPIALPLSEHLRLLDLRDALRNDLQKNGQELNLESLTDLDADLRQIYIVMAERLRKPSFPELRNLDGDPISLVKIYFEISCSTGEAFEKLKDLDCLREGQEIPDDAQYDEAGNLIKVIVDCMKSKSTPKTHSENTVLGRLTICDGELIAEVNSERRAREIQSEIEARLKEKVIFKRAVHELVDGMVEERINGVDEDEDQRARDENERIKSLPELQAVLRKTLELHWEAWYEQPLPALGDISPVEAAKTKAGRERLNVLLRSFESKNEVVPPELRVDIAAMKKRLGL